jgi:putative ABC transport system ATP-binding protein
MARRAPVVDVRGVSKTYRSGRWEIHALRDLSFTVEPGHVLAIMGPSGSGKTTLLNIIAGLDRPTSGEVLIDGQRLGLLHPDEATEFRRRHMGFVFQFFNLLPTMTARDNVALPLLAERLGRHDVEARTMRALEAVGLAHRAAHRPAELSGGEMQRVAIARALVMQPHLLLADEPTGNLDTTTGDEILALLRQAVEEFSLAIVMVTHSHLAAAVADRILFLRDGAVIDDVRAGREEADVGRPAWPRLVPPRGKS